MIKPTIVLIGAGKFGKNHLRVLKELEAENQCEFVGVVDKDEELLSEISKKYNLSVSNRIDSFLTEKIDAFDVVTPSSTHYELCKKILNKNINVFVEKPLTLSYDESRRLGSIALKKNLVLMVGHIFRYNAAVKKIKEIISTDKNQKKYIYGHFLGLNNPQYDMGSLYNYAVHHVDTYNYLLGELPTEVFCINGYYLERPNFEDVSLLTLKYPSGTMAHFEGSWLIPIKERSITIISKDYCIISDLLKQNIKLFHTGIENLNGKLIAFDNGFEDIKIDFKEPLKLELMDFISSIKNKSIPDSNWTHALIINRILDAALKSAKTSRRVKLNWESK